MAIKLQVSAELILGGHPGVTTKSKTNECIADFFPEGSYRYQDCTDVLDGTVEAKGTHNCTEGELFVYRECGKTACRRQIGLVINGENRIIDAQPFVSPCTGKL